MTLINLKFINENTGPDKVNIGHLKHIGPLGIAYLTNMYNILLISNIIPHTWELANIIPIPKPNKDMNIGTSYRPISLLSVIAKTLEKTLFPYTTNTIFTQYGFKGKHSTSTALHNKNNTTATGFNQNKPPERTITVAQDINKAFDTVDIHIIITMMTYTNSHINYTKQTSHIPFSN